MRRLFFIWVLACPLFAQSAPYPHILGLAHVSFRVGDLGRAVSFYKNVLGYEEPFALKDENGNVTMAFVKVNDEQYVELIPGDARIHGFLDHFALYTSDLTTMRTYLVNHQIELVRDIHAGRIGNPFLTVRDPDGHLIEILQYVPSSKTTQARGKFISASRVSEHITHVGILINSIGVSLKFYRDVLGFREVARGGGTTGQPGWVSLQSPDGNDSIELIPFSGVPSPAELRAQNHLCLGTTDIHKAVTTLQGRASSDPLAAAVSWQSGGNLPLRANLADPDGDRIELMQSNSQPANSQSTPSP